jgi:hypothetical protein
MKPATLGLFAFLASFMVYTVAGFLLAGVINSNSITPSANQTYPYEVAIAVALIGSIVTGYLAWIFEGSPNTRTKEEES